MADFCRACTEELAPGYGVVNDFVGVGTRKDNKNGSFGLVLCEGCGPIQVDYKGNCISGDCLKSNQPGHGVRIKY